MESSEKKVIMISGANRGIGRAIAERLLADGYLLSLGVRNLGKLPKSLNPQVETQMLCHIYDARDRESAKRWVNLTAEKFGGIDVLVNNAGIYGPKGAIEDQNWDEWKKTIEINSKKSKRRFYFPTAYEGLLTARFIDGCVKSSS